MDNTYNIITNQKSIIYKTMIYSDNTYDITNNIATYTRRDFKSVFDTASNKWYMLNNLDEYEEYGIYGDSFDTYYTGKLVIVNNHEYEWNGTEWDDLGEAHLGPVSLYRDSTHTGYITFPQTTSDVISIDITFKMNILPNQSGLGKSFFIGSGTADENDWRIFLTGNVATGGNTFYYDCGSGRFTATGLLNTKKHFRLCGSPMKIYDYDTNTYIYEDLDENIRPTGFPIYFGYFQRDGVISANYGYLYDLVFYSDNEGQNAIAHYIPYIQNETVGMYDTINDVFVPATGTLGAESGSARPKDYPAKAVPTISTLWASTIYRNSAHLTTLMRNDVEQAIWSYMEDDILKKGEALPPIDYLCFEANTAGSTIALSNTNISPNIEYSRDKKSWTTWNYSALTLQNVGDKIYMRGSNPNGIGLTEANVSKFVMTGSISVSGNIMTLIDKVGETLIIPSDYCFRNLFRQCTSLVEANISFPATTLTNNCYDNIFRECTNLVYGPVELPAETLYVCCYRSMFNGCTSLITSPILKGTVLARGSYEALFYNSNISQIITYATNVSATYGITNWVGEVPSTGDFYNLGGATYQSGASGIPSGWTIHTSL